MNQVIFYTSGCLWSIETPVPQRRRDGDALPCCVINHRHELLDEGIADELFIIVQLHGIVEEDVGCKDDTGTTVQL